MDLSARLSQMIRREGPLRFDRFMAAALYDADGGYYERPGRVGREGDFVTGASWHPAFARALARIARSVAAACGTLRVVDVGAGEGELLANLAEALAGEGAELVGVEASATRRALGKARVPRATWLADAAELPAGGKGLVVAYELLDALPVRSFRLGGDGALRERRVGLSGAGFGWEEADAADGERVLAGLAARGAVLEPGQVLEVRPGAKELARTLARAVGTGALLLFDYGARTRPLYSAAVRPNGTLEAFRGHQVSRDVLGEPGSRDITAWVDFGEIEEALAAEGLAVRGLVSQARLLLAGGIAEEMALADPETPLSPERAVERNAVAKLFMPGGMGESLRCLVAERGTGVLDGLLSGR